MKSCRDDLEIVSETFHKPPVPPSALKVVRNLAREALFHGWSISYLKMAHDKGNSLSLKEGVFPLHIKKPAR